jgi:hypothetical protein
LKKLTNRFKKFTAVIMLMALMLSLIPLPVFAETLQPEGYTLCANEGETCSFSGTRSVAYGANGVFNYKTITTSTPCTNEVFGDPIGGVVKSCYYNNTTTETIAPTTTDDAPTGWVNTPATVTLSVYDGGSGVAATNYTVDGGPQQTGTSVDLTAEGIHTIAYWSVDIAGNVEEQHTTTVKIDKTAPTTSDNAPTGWVNTPVTVILSGNDSGSGFAATNYTIDGGAQQTGTSVDLTAEGVHTIVYWSVDHVGNIEAQHSKTVTVKLLPIKSNGQFHIDDIVKLITQGTLQEKDMNGDSIFDVKDVMIMLNGVTSVLIPM